MISKERDVYILNTSGNLITNEEVVAVDNLIDSSFDKGPKKMVVDLALSDYVTSKFIDICFSRLNEARQNDGDIKFVHVSAAVKSVFEAAGISEYMDFYPSVTDAINSFSDNVSGAEKNMLWQ